MKITTAATAATAAQTVDEDARTISGLIVPFGRVGRTSSGSMTFGPGSLTFTDPARVKLLIEHDHNRAVGHAQSIDVTDAGYVATFRVDDGPLGDAALAQAASRSRDGISIGVELDDRTRRTASRARDAATPGAGALRECSLVAVPAFDDARVTGVGSRPAQPAQPTAAAAAPQGDNTMPVLTTTTAADVTTGSTTPEAPQTDPQTTTATADPAPGAQAATPTTATSGPAAPPAMLAPATVEDAPVYSFTGNARHSMILDQLAARDGDADAAHRLASFRAAMADDQSPQTAQFAAAITEGDVHTATAAVQVGDASTQNITPDGYRPDMILRAIDKGRPFASRVRSMPIANGSPFRLPTIGDFDGVGAHTEGTNHVGDGSIDVDGQTITPRAVSGAWRASRELIESTGPRIDSLVLPEMVKDYRREGEAFLVAKLQTVKAVHDAASIDTPAALNAELVTFYADRGEAPSVVAFGRTAYTTFANTTAGDGRPYYPHLNPTNAAGSTGAGFMSMNVQGVPGVLAWPAAPADMWLVNGDDVILFESAPRTFRFEEVEGPGIIKLALWGYQAAHVFRTIGVRRVKVGA